MTKQLSAVLAAAAFIGISGATYAANDNWPMSVNDTGPVLTAQQQKYIDEQDQARGVAGRAGFADEAPAAFYEVKTPSAGHPISD